MRRSAKAAFAVGCLLILGSLGLLAATQLRVRQAREENAEILRVMEEVLPPRREGLADTYRNMEMPALEIGGEDFAALLEIPAFGVTLPVSNHWEKGDVTLRPCRFWGTVYDGSLIVGGADQPGQFDCFDRIPNGANVTVTDMTGAEFSYAVARVERSDSARAEVLLDEEAELTLFVRDAYSLEYIILRCVVSP